MAGGAPRTNVYVDAFNLYYGSLKNTSYKWLDLLALCNAYLKGNNICSIKYFTAQVKARPTDPQQPARQQAYLRALATLPCVEIIFGHYLSHSVKAKLAKTPPQGSPFVTIIKTEEKGSDVNLATHLVHDAHLNRFDVAVVVSNDSDLLTPIQVVRSELGKQVGILNPHAKPSKVLLKHSDFFKAIRQGALQNSQFPDKLTDKHGTIQKPTGW